jgi:hypothetical protein
VGAWWCVDGEELERERERERESVCDKSGEVEGCRLRFTVDESARTFNLLGFCRGDTLQLFAGRSKKFSSRSTGSLGFALSADIYCRSNKLSRLILKFGCVATKTGVVEFWEFSTLH